MSRWPARTLCAICGLPKRTGDPITRGHIIPQSLGGTDDPWNIRPEHRSCNGARGSQMTREDAAEVAIRREAWESARKGLHPQDIRLRRHQVALPSGAVAEIFVPRDLTPEEADRLAAFVLALQSPPTDLRVINGGAA